MKDDLISRKVVLEELEKVFEEYGMAWGEEYGGFAQAVPETIAKIPAEHGALIVKLPVTVGDTVYKICPVSKYIEMGDMRDGKIVKTECARCGYRSAFSGCHDIGFQKDARNVIVPRKMTSLVDIVKILPFWNEIYYRTEEEAAAAVARMLESE